MRKLRFQVNRNEAVRLIRSGAGDSLLMETFHLSASGLQKLFGKLVAANEIEQSELDRRMLASGRSHVIDLTDEPVARTQKALIQTDEAARDIHAGMSDIDLMEKYNLSASGLQSLLDKLLDAGRITVREFDQRQNVAGWKSPEIPSEEDYGAFGEVQSTWGEALRAGRVSRFVHRHRVVIATSVGLLAGMAVMAGLIHICGGDMRGIDTARPGKTGVSQEVGDQDFAKQIDEAIAVLEAVVRDQSSPGTPSAASEASALQQCLENCKHDHSGKEVAEKDLLMACRRECLQTHSETFRRIRQRYHGIRE